MCREDIAEQQRKVAQDLFPPLIATIVQSTREIFIQAIADLAPPQLAFDGRVALVGDSGFILRPHTAAGEMNNFCQFIWHDLIEGALVDSSMLGLAGLPSGTTKAALNAEALAAALRRHNFDVPKALEDYSHGQMKLGMYLRKIGISIGNNSQFPDEETIKERQ